ncbi:hypothetical protein CRM22_002165 [Opisthorchis felineus]|uniref:Uncharacterized protein n=1 Tax=Opisthorchis felineus TaxID=147828 RepID=A0A4S2M7G6_OPIFE|nr:hypothetical protein CRM22_002165 [Opisthorchis felineus]
MYPPPRPWDRDSPRRYGPPGRFPRRRSRSPIPPMPDRYPYPEPPAGPPFRNAPATSPYPRGPRSNEPFPSRARPDEFAYERSVPYREPEMGDYYEPPRRGPERPMDRRPVERPIERTPPPKYDKRLPEEDRGSFRPPRYPESDGDYYPVDGRRRDFPSPGRGIPAANGPRGYPPAECPPFVPPKEFGPGESRPPPRGRSPEPRYNYRSAEKPVYPPRGGWYRGPSPRRW